MTIRRSDKVPRTGPGKKLSIAFLSILKGKAKSDPSALSAENPGPASGPEGGPGFELPPEGVYSTCYLTSLPEQWMRVRLNIVL